MVDPYACIMCCEHHPGPCIENEYEAAEDDLDRAIAAKENREAAAEDDYNRKWRNR